MATTYTAKGGTHSPRTSCAFGPTNRSQTAPAGTNYDVAPDRERISALMAVEAPEAQRGQNHVVFLENFFDQLRRRVLTGK